MDYGTGNGPQYLKGASFAMHTAIAVPPVTAFRALSAFLFLLSFLISSECGATEIAQSGAPASGLPSTILLLPGTRVRIDAPSLLSSQLVGKVLALRSDTLEVTGRVVTPTAKSATWTGPVPLSAIGNLERSNGSKGHGLVGMGIGLIIGAAVVPALFGSSSTANNEIPDYSPILFGIGGAILGGIIGAQFRTERWEKVR
jgi:hypothetical protein